jgi:hypothetical protein
VEKRKNRYAVVFLLSKVLIIIVDETSSSSSGSQQTRSENSIFGMTLEVAVALTKIDKDDLIPAVFRRCIEYLDDIGVHEVGIYR